MINVNAPEVLFIRDRQQSDRKADLKTAAETALRLGLVDSIACRTKADLWETVYLAQSEIADHHL